MISRRGFLTSCAAILVALHAAEAQEAGKVPRVGILAAGSAAEAPNTVFFARMRELGYVEGQTVVFERRFAGGRIEDLPALAAQLVTTKPDVISHQSLPLRSRPEPVRDQ